MYPEGGGLNTRVGIGKKDAGCLDRYLLWGRVSASLRNPLHGVKRCASHALYTTRGYQAQCPPNSRWLRSAASPPARSPLWGGLVLPGPEHRLVLFVREDLPRPLPQRLDAEVHRVTGGGPRPEVAEAGGERKAMMALVGWVGGPHFRSLHAAIPQLCSAHAANKNHLA